MHEFSLAQDLHSLASREARNAGITRIDRIFIQVGTISGVNIDALEFAWGFVRDEDELAKSAELEIEIIQGMGKCGNCGADVELDRFFLYCRECETPGVDITQGREFMLVSIEGIDESEESEEAARQERSIKDG